MVSVKSQNQIAEISLKKSAIIAGISLLLMAINAALGYLIDGSGKLLSSDYNLNISMFTFIGEVVLIFLLLIKGRKIEA